MTLLAGPILRRVTANRVCVWFASRELIHLKLQVISENGDILGESAPLTKNDYCQLGQQLFVYLLQAPANPETAYPVNTFLYYQLIDANNKAVDLSALTYDNNPNPKFFIPTDLKRLLHGSCRKPHGGGKSADALSYGDTLLTTTHNDINKRPAVLLLSGDQIYADDVSVYVLELLKKQAADLIGRPELIPYLDAQDNIIYKDPQNIAPNGREVFLNEHHSGFTSSEAENHLMAFGEFAAMYIYVFGNAENWSITDENWESFVQEVSEKHRAKAKKAKKEVEDLTEKAKNELTSVKTFQATLSNVRRLLANVPTYMIFDDHDVTDDWNITSKWYNDVRTSPVGQRVVANALASFWTFQGWGNEPDNFDKDLRASISQYLLDTTNAAEINESYDLHTWHKRGCGFSVPTNPPIIAIDSRTQRVTTKDNYLPVLIDRYACDWLRLEWAKLKSNPALNISNQTTPVFIATTPVLGFSLMEGIQEFLCVAADLIESYEYVRYFEKLIGKEGWLINYMINFADVEAWTSNEQSFLTLMDCLSKDMAIKQCVFLSGDVHYSFTAIGNYNRSTTTEPLRCYQLVSSSLKNAPEETQGAYLEKLGQYLGDTKHSNKLKKLFPWLPISSWESSVRLLPSQGQTRVNVECNLGLVDFENGLAKQHTLLMGDEIIYPLTGL
ncbi:MAG: hypothetical protein WAX77_03550 [Methylococcaceae bacterium]